MKRTICLARATLLLFVMLFTTTTAWAQYPTYALTVEPNFSGATDDMIESIMVGYDHANGNNNRFIGSSYYESKYNRGAEWKIIGWATTADGAIEYEANTTVILTGSLTIYAKWANTEQNYIVTFYASGGTGTMAAVAQAKESNYTIPACGYTRSGYSFIGWATSPGGEVEYLPGGIITSLTADLTLYAKWGLVDITVSFDANGGYGSMDVGKVSGTIYTFPECGFKRDGYTFVGWKDQYGVAYQPWQSIMLTNDLTLYAQWGAIQNGLKYLFTSENPYRVELKGYDGDKPTGTLTIPSSITFGGHEYSVTSIGDWGFGGCTGLTTISIPNSVTSISGFAFDGCTSLSSVTIPASVTSIGPCAFYWCTGLTSVFISASVTSIGSQAFECCPGLTSVTIYAPSLTEYGFSAFNGNSSGRKIYVFSDCVDTYKVRASLMGVDENDIEAIPALKVQGGEMGCWCTYYNGLADVTVADGTTVYTAKRNNAGGVTLTETGSQIVNRGEAVLLKSNADVVLSSATDSGEGVYTDNELQGVDVQTTQDINTTYYELSKPEGEDFGFYMLQEGIDLDANKAYLAVEKEPSSGVSGAPVFYGFDFEEEEPTTTAIASPQPSPEGEGAIFNLNGQRIKMLQKGLNIVDGKKVVVK